MSLELAEHYGVRVSVDDLGDWGASMLVAEYDPSGPSIRVNTRALERLCGNDRAARSALMDEAIAHELYHHREAIGAIARLKSHAARERAAREYARARG